MAKSDLSEGIFSGNQLKIIALVAMTCDHVGKQILPDIEILQIFGRLAFPIFAYMIAEGCRYTKNRKKYLATMMVMAFACQLVYFIAMKSLYQCILVTFSLSIALIYLIDNAMNKKDLKSFVFVLLGYVGVYILTEVLPNVLVETDFYIDYGFWGVMFAVFVFIANKKLSKLTAATIALVFMCIFSGGIQWYSLAAILLLALYNGKKGKMRIKNLFYIYYPLHLVVIYLVSTFVNG